MSTVSYEGLHTNRTVWKLMRELLEIVRTGSTNSSIHTRITRAMQEIPNVKQEPIRRRWLQVLVEEVKRVVPSNHRVARDVVMRAGVNLEMLPHQWDEMSKLSWFHYVDREGNPRDRPNYLVEKRFVRKRERTLRHLIRRENWMAKESGKRCGQSSSGSQHVAAVSQGMQYTRSPTLVVGRRSVEDVQSLMPSRSSQQLRESPPSKRASQMGEVLSKPPFIVPSSSSVRSTSAFPNQRAVQMSEVTSKPHFRESTSSSVRSTSAFPSQRAVQMSEVTSKPHFREPSSSVCSTSAFQSERVVQMSEVTSKPHFRELSSSVHSTSAFPNDERTPSESSLIPSTVPSSFDKLPTIRSQVVIPPPKEKSFSS